MSDRPVPTAEQLKRAALGGDLGTMLALATSDVIVIHTLVNASQAVLALREQVAQLDGSQDATNIAILEAHAAAESLIERCAQAAHLVLKDMYNAEQRRNAARYN